MSLRPLFKKSQLNKYLRGQSRAYPLFTQAVDQETSCRFKVQVRGVRGSGAGKGGGAGGSIRESGGSLGQYGAANEEGYFYQKQLEQLRELKEKLKLKKDESKDKPDAKP